MTTQDDLAEAALDNTVALNPLIGISYKELLKALNLVLNQSVKQPRLLRKHFVSYGKELLGILAGKSDLAPAPKDRRYADSSWQTNPFYKRGMQAWLAMQKNLMEWVDDTELSNIDKAKARFILGLMIDALAPTNTLIGNPSALKKVIDTGGMSLINGLKNAFDDLINNKGMPSQVDKRPFEVGKNLAVTEGAVIYRNELLELLQYKPRTEKVFRRPYLAIPPQINKYYVMDLSPEKSMIRFLAEQGQQVFAISWRNPTAEESHWSLQDYLDAILAAIDVVLQVTGQKNLNIGGACSGGITMATLLNQMQLDKDNRINSITMQVCVLHPQNEDTELGMFASKRAIRTARALSARRGILAGDELGRMFAWMRPNDLIWNYVVNNYLHGESPPPFDILYWNNDSTNLPAALHSDFLDLYESQPFANPGTEYLGRPVDLGQLKQDAFVVGAITDHITPWRACYRTTQLLGGKTRFVLSNAGHIQALINPPGNPKSKYFTNVECPPDCDEWLQGASEHPGSWWVLWAEWLGDRAGTKKQAPTKLGNKPHPILEDAPGSYVHG